MSEDGGRAGRRAGALRVGLALAVVLQLVVLYEPANPGEGPFPGADKLVHATVFLLPTLLGLLVGLPARVVVPVLAGHAVVSELVQGFLLADRSGDPLDVVADLVGVALGALFAGRRRRVR